MIGLIVAEKQEVGSLIKTIQAKIIEFNGVRYYIGEIKGHQIVVCFSGVGKVNAAIAATNMIINFGVDKIFNIGLCGACKANIKPGDFLIASSIEYSDVDLTAFDYPLNQIPEEPTRFDIKQTYIDNLKTLIPQAHVGVIASADSVITIKNVEAFPTLVNQEVVGFDMEAVALAQVCNKTKTDFLCVKVVSDNLTLDTSSKSQYDTSFKTLGRQIEAVTIKVLEFYSNNK